tara:strand:+ start:760 stop:972 length:213 start_codon:yes stop_codon:yes gene_type:complete
MSTTYLIAKSYNTVTGQTLMHKDLNGARFPLDQRKLAQDFSEKYAEKLSIRTGETWTAQLVEYTPGIVRA